MTCAPRRRGVADLKMPCTTRQAVYGIVEVADRWSYLLPVPLTVPEDDAPVDPDVPVVLEVPALPEPLPEVEGVVAVEPLDDPMPDDDPETEEPLELGAVDDELADGVEEEEGATEPVAEPVLDPMPEADPVADPDALGPVELQAASANAQAKGAIHLIMLPPGYF